MSPIKKSPLLNDRNLYVIFGITLVSVMGVSSIAPALPSIARTFSVTNDQIGLLITFYTLPGIILTPILGVIADRYGRKRVLIPSLFFFGIAGTACAFATSFEQLLFLRALQGMGSASLGALNLTLIGDLYSGNDRATAMGYNGSVLSVGAAAYPAIGGAIAILGWFYPFYLALLAIPVGIFALLSLEAVSLQNKSSLNLYFNQIGSALKSGHVIGLFVSMFLTFIMLYGGYITYFTILLDERFGLSSMMIGLLLASSSLVTALTSAQLGKLTLRFSERTLIRTAAILYFISFLMVPSISGIWGLLLPIGLFGFAQGINIASILNMLAGYAKAEYRAAFLSINWVIMRVGQALGPYLLGLVYYYYNIDGTFYFAAGAGALFILVSLTMIRK